MRSNKPTILPRISRNSGMSPYTYAYESLNGNGGISRTIYVWRRFLIGGTVLIILAWISLGWSGLGGSSYDDRTSEVEFEAPIPHLTSLPGYRPPTRPPPGNTKPPPVLSFTADRDPSSTTQCTQAYTDPEGMTRPIVQWALMIDAGSTGSRIHIYKFNNCKSSPSFEYEVFRQTRPGLSSYASNPEEAAESLDKLMREAEEVVPKSLWKCTPVAVKATAGLRLLGTSQSEAILQAVRWRLESKYKFNVVHDHGVEIMDGKDEGVHAWVTANYLLEALGGSSSSATPYAVLDLGGASTQIVFKPSFDLDGDGIDDDGRTLEDGEHKYILHFQGTDHVLYQHSYLGYGLMQARAHVHKLVEFMSLFTTNSPPKHIGDEHDDDDDVPIVYNPCIARGMQRRVEVDVGREGMTIKKNVTMTGGEVGSWEACNRVLELVLAKDAVCHLKPCSFNGVYQPSLLDSFPTGPILLLSYFYDRLAPLLTPTLPPPSTPSSPRLDPTEDLIFPISTIKWLAQTICGGEESWMMTPFPFPLEGEGSAADNNAPRAWSESPELMEELYGRPEWCLDLSFMYALLRLGYEFGEERGVRIGKQVHSTELGWCLGATLGLLGNAEFECRI